MNGRSCSAVQSFALPLRGNAQLAVSQGALYCAAGCTAGVVQPASFFLLAPAPSKVTVNLASVTLSPRLDIIRFSSTKF